MGLNRSVGQLVSSCLTALVALSGRADAAVVTNAADAQRTGWYSDEASLTPALVSGAGFAQRFATAVQGQIYAQPLVAKRSLFVATEENWIYRLDPDNGLIQWSRQVAPPWNPADIGCGDLVPWVGITGTPVIDDATNTAYFFAKTYASGTAGPAAWYAHAVDLITGEERPNFPVAIQGTAQNSPQLFNPTNQLQRPGLLLMDGVVYAGFGGHCDISPWQGWIVGVTTSGQIRSMWTARGTLNGNGAAIWHSGGGIVSDGPGRLIVATGNGGAPASAIPGSTPPADLGESVVRLQVQGDGTLRAVDFFAPYNANLLDAVDGDLGSGGPTALPAPYFGTATFPHLAVEVGKQGLVYMLNRDNLGGCRQGPGARDAVINEVGPYAGVWARPSSWAGDGGWVYIPTNAGPLNFFRYVLDGTGKPTLALASATPDNFGFASSSTVVTSNGTANGSALVWIVYEQDGSGLNGQLRAYEAAPATSTPALKFSAAIGNATKFNPPGVAYGRVYVGARDGHVVGFGPSVVAVRVDKNVATGSTHVSWTGGNAPFSLRRAEDPDFTVNPVVLVDHQTATSYDDPVLGDGKSYFYEVR